MKTIVFSQDGKYYYIKELVCPHCNWVGTVKHKTLTEAKIGWVSEVAGYDTKDPSKIAYYRTVLPFTFWKVKEGREIQVEDDNELVQDYVPCGKHFISPVK